MGKRKSFSLLFCHTTYNSNYYCNINEITTTFINQQLMHAFFVLVTFCSDSFRRLSSPSSGILFCFLQHVKKTQTFVCSKFVIPSKLFKYPEVSKQCYGKSLFHHDVCFYLKIFFFKNWLIGIIVIFACFFTLGTSSIQHLNVSTSVAKWK